jgi:predicted double-glycine peptidase
MKLLALLLLSSVALAAPGVPELPLNALPVPLVPQAYDYTCGPAALLSVLYYWGVYDGHETDLYKPLHTSKRNGTEPEKLAEGAKGFGLESDWRRDMTLDELRAALNEGYTAILDLQAWRDKNLEAPWSAAWEDGHYVVLVALDAENAFFMDPSSHAGYGWMPITELLERWHDKDKLGGHMTKFQHLAVLIRGREGLHAIPGPLVRIQ